MKYDSQLANLKIQLPNVKKALIALPQNSSIDKLASALALNLALKQAGKEVVIVCPDNLTVSQSHLFGIGDIKNQIPTQSDGNYVLSLAGVVDQNGMVPALAGLDWYPEGQNLNLVFKINPGQTFEPKEIAARTENSGFNMIFVIGSASISDLGAIYQTNANRFTEAPIVNIDNNPSNGNFGWTNVVDSQTSSLSEIMVTVLSSLGLLSDPDTATNLLTGIYESTNNLTQYVTADTFMTTGMAFQVGGKLPGLQTPVSTSINSIQPEPTSTFVPSVVESQPVMTQPENPVVSNESYDLSKIFGITPSEAQAATVTPVTTDQAVSAPLQETPVGEAAITPGIENPSNPTPDWLVPKIYSGKGGGLG